jgi:hypothetical protein
MALLAGRRNAVEIADHKFDPISFRAADAEEPETFVANNVLQESDAAIFRA